MRELWVLQNGVCFLANLKFGSHATKLSGKRPKDQRRRLPPTSRWNSIFSGHGCDHEVRTLGAFACLSSREGLTPVGTGLNAFRWGVTIRLTSYGGAARVIRFAASLTPVSTISLHQESAPRNYLWQATCVTLGVMLNFDPAQQDSEQKWVCRSSVWSHISCVSTLERFRCNMCGCEFHARSDVAWETHVATKKAVLM